MLIALYQHTRRVEMHIWQIDTAAQKGRQVDGELERADARHLGLLRPSRVGKVNVLRAYARTQSEIDVELAD
jgi:hypothetical protein